MHIETPPHDEQVTPPRHLHVVAPAEPDDDTHGAGLIADRARRVADQPPALAVIAASRYEYVYARIARDDAFTPAERRILDVTIAWLEEVRICDPSEGGTLREAMRQHA